MYMQNKMEVNSLIYSMNIIINYIVKLKAFKYEYFTFCQNYLILIL